VGFQRICNRLRHWRYSYCIGDLLMDNRLYAKMLLVISSLAAIDFALTFISLQLPLILLKGETAAIVVSLAEANILYNYLGLTGLALLNIIGIAGLAVGLWFMKWDAINKWTYRLLGGMRFVVVFGNVVNLCTYWQIHSIAQCL